MKKRFIFIACRRVPGSRSLNSIANHQFLPHGLRRNPFPSRVDFFETVHPIELRGGGSPGAA